MAMTKAEVRRAFREAMAADYADIPAKEDIDHVFSPAFYAKMDALIAEQKRGSWRLLSRQSRRALVAAAILAASLLLVACTPTLREAVSELVVTVYETFVDFIVPEQTDTTLRAEIETVYEFDPIPEGFKIESQEQESPYYVETIYIGSLGNRIVLRQFASAGSISSADAEDSSLCPETIFGTQVWFSSARDIQTAVFFRNGYRFRISHIGTTTETEFAALVESFLLANDAS